jgi:WD40 repeat protein
VIGDGYGQIKIYNSSSLSLVNSFQAHSENIWKIKQSPFNTNINYVATCSWDKTVKIWNVSSFSSKWTLITEYSRHSSSVADFEWSDKDTLASAGQTDQTIQVWSLTTGQTKKTIQTNQNVASLTMLNSKIHLATGLGYGDINIYNINDVNLVSSLKGHTSNVFDLVQLSSDLLASSSGDRTVRIWNLTTNTCKFILTGHTLNVYGLKQITPSILASGSQDKTIKLWNITSGQLIRTLTGHTGEIWWSVDLLNSQTLVSGHGDGTIKLWNWSTGECLSTIQTTGSYIYALAVIDMNQQQQTTTTPMSSKFSCFLLFLFKKQ